MSDLQRARWTAGRLQSELLAHIIRALTPADATAAMEAKLWAERNKVRREASDMLMRRPVPPDDVSAVIACRDAILAMIEPEGK